MKIVNLYPLDLNIIPNTSCIILNTSNIIQIQDKIWVPSLSKTKRYYEEASNVVRLYASKGFRDSSSVKVGFMARDFQQIVNRCGNPWSTR